MAAEVVEPYDTSESAPPPGDLASPAPVPPQPSVIQETAEPAGPSAPEPSPTPPPAGWYSDAFGNPPRWWDGTVWTEDVLVPDPSAEPVDEEPELNFFDKAMISFSLAPDWAKFLAAAAVTVVLAAIGLGLLNGDSSSDDVPDGFVPQTPELEDGAPAEPGSDVTR